MWRRLALHRHRKRCASIARRASAAEAVRVIEQASGQGWTLAEITRDRQVIDEVALRQAAELEATAA